MGKEKYVRDIDPDSKYEMEEILSKFLPLIMQNDWDPACVYTTFLHIIALGTPKDAIPYLCDELMYLGDFYREMEPWDWEKFLKERTDGFPS